MSYLNNTDIATASHRNSINRFKKNKGVKRSKTEKYAESKFWKRAKSIRLHKQSREDNYVGETFPDFHPANDLCAATAAVSQHPEPQPEPETLNVIEQHNLNESSIIKVSIIYAENEEFNNNIDVDVAYVHVSPYWLDTAIVTLKRKIESELKAKGTVFQFEYDGAVWECLSKHHHFMLQLMVIKTAEKDPVIVIEKTLLRGDAKKKKKDLHFTFSKQPF